MRFGPDSLNVYPLVDLAVGLGNQMPCRVLERIGKRGEEEIGLQNFVCLCQSLLGLLKVKVDVESLDELGNGVAVLVRLLSHDAHEVLELLLVSAVAALCDGTVPVGDDGGGEIA